MLVKAILITEFKNKSENIALDNISPFIETPSEKIELMLKTYGYYKDHSSSKEKKSKINKINILIDTSFEGEDLSGVYLKLIGHVPFKYTINQ